MNNVGARCNVPLQYVRRIFIIQGPLQWVVPDVLLYLSQFCFIPDNTLEIIALPDRTAGGIADGVDVFGHR